jgi:hypothetical protein
MFDWLNQIAPNVPLAFLLFFGGLLLFIGLIFLLVVIRLLARIGRRGANPGAYPPGAYYAAQAHARHRGLGNPMNPHSPFNPNNPNSPAWKAHHPH